MQMYNGASIVLKGHKYGRVYKRCFPDILTYCTMIKL